MNDNTANYMMAKDLATSFREFSMDKKREFLFWSILAVIVQTHMRITNEDILAILDRTAILEGIEEYLTKAHKIAMDIDPNFCRSESIESSVQKAAIVFDNLEKGQMLKDGRLTVKGVDFTTEIMKNGFAGFMRERMGKSVDRN